MANSQSDSEESQRHIPIEVIEVIIDYLYNDKQSLRSCSRVARRWVPTSRFHLIPSIRVHAKNYRQLIYLLNAPHTRIAYSVRELNLAGYGKDGHAWMNEAIPELVKHFTSVTSVCIGGVKWRQLTARNASYLHSFTKAKKVLLIDCFFITFEQLVELICSFRVLEHLNVVASKCDRQGPLPSSRLTVSPRITELLIDEVYPLLKQWLANQIPLRLEHFYTNDVSLPNFHNLKALVTRAGSALKHLQVRFEDDYMQQDTQPHLDLSQNTSLQILEITIGFPNPWSPYMGLPGTCNLSFLVPLLSSISSPSFTLMIFRILVGEPDDLMAIKWRQIDKIFNENPSFTHMKKVQFELTDMSPNVVPEDFMEEAELIVYPGLNNTAKRGLLDVRFVPLPRK